MLRRKKFSGKQEIVTCSCGKKIIRPVGASSVCACGLDIKKTEVANE